MAWNVRQGGGSRCPAIATAIGHLAPDVVFVSEYRSTGSGELAELLRAEGYDQQLGGHNPVVGGHTGLLVASRLVLEPGWLGYRSESDAHRFCHVRANGWDLVGAYIPGGDAGGDRKRLFWRFLVDHVAQELLGRNALIIGDLNTGLHYRDELGATFACAEMMQVLFERGWRDAWIERNRKARPPATWHSTGGNPYRLDHAILAPNAPRASDVGYPVAIAGQNVLGPGNLSDHLPVVVDLKSVPPL